MISQFTSALHEMTMLSYPIGMSCVASKAVLLKLLSILKFNWKWIDNHRPKLIVLAWRTSSQRHHQPDIRTKHWSFRNAWDARGSNIDRVSLATVVLKEISTKGTISPKSEPNSNLFEMLGSNNDLVDLDNVVLKEISTKAPQVQNPDSDLLEISCALDSFLYFIYYFLFYCWLEKSEYNVWRIIGLLKVESNP